MESLSRTPTTTTLLIILFAIFSVIDAGSVLYSGKSLVPGCRNLTYSNYTLTMNPDCNLVLLDNTAGAILWQTNTGYGSRPGCNATLDTTGVLTVYWFPNYALWKSQQSPNPNGSYALVVRYDGRLALHGPSLWRASREYRRWIPPETPSPWPKTKDSVLFTGDVAPIGTTVVNGEYELTLRKDCNLVLTVRMIPALALWNSGVTSPWKDCYVTLEGSGLVKVKHLAGVDLWSSVNRTETYGDDYVLALDPYGVLASYGPRRWISDSGAGAGAAAVAVA